MFTRRVTPVLLEAGEHYGEQAPRGRIVDRPRTQRYCAHGCAGELFEMDDSREHGKRGDTHRCTKKEHCLRERSGLWKQRCVVKKNPSQPDSQRKWRQHAGE
jgi:hypothetical protein